MDIIEVLKSKYTADRLEAAFDINAVLSNPSAEDAVDRLDKAVLRYSTLDVGIHTLSRLQQEAGQSTTPTVQKDED